VDSCKKAPIVHIAGMIANRLLPSRAGTGMQDAPFDPSGQGPRIVAFKRMQKRMLRSGTRLVRIVQVGVSASSYPHLVNPAISAVALPLRRAPGLNRPGAYSGILTIDGRGGLHLAYASSARVARPNGQAVSFSNGGHFSIHLSQSRIPH
jgi:hypothetical protein